MNKSAKLGFLTVLILVSQQTTLASEVVFNDNMQGCSGGKTVVTPYTPHGDSCYSNKIKTVSRKDLKELVKIIESSNSFSEFSPDLLGITPQTAQEHYNDILNASIQLRDPIYKKIKIGQIRELEYPEICKSAKNRLFARDNSRTHVKFSATINDPSINLEKIDLSSMHDVPYMLPWTVQIGTRRWKTYSTDLPKELAKFVNKSGYCASILDGKDFWQKEFWKEMRFWSSEIGYQLHKTNCQNFAKTLPGYAKAMTKFRIIDIDSGDFYLKSSALLLELEMTNPQTISSITWWNRYKDSIATSDWTHATRMVEICEQAVSTKPWLVAWKESKPSNQLRCFVDGAKLYEEGDLKTYVVPAWRDAGLKGLPEIEIAFSRSDKSHGRMFLSSRDTHVLIIEAEPRKGTHWFDKLEVSFHPITPNYILISPDGKITRRKINSNSKYLPKWARKASKQKSLN